MINCPMVSRGGGAFAPWVPVTEGVGQHHTASGWPRVLQAAGRANTLGRSELVGVVGVPSAEENKKHARHRFLISTAGLWWRVEKPVPEEARLPPPPAFAC